MAKKFNPPSYDMSLADHGFDATEYRGLTYPLGEHAPEIGELYHLLPDIGWTRLPVPGNLRHINIWLLADEDEHGEGVAIVDTGLQLPDTIAAWEKLFAGPLKDKRVTRVIVTHFHPDHVGMAGWLCKKFGVRLWMNRTEWLMARMLTADIRNAPPEEAIGQMRLAGWDEARLENMRQKGWGNFAKAVSPLPLGHVRLFDEQLLTIGHRKWRILTGGGHTPEHSCLYDEDNKIIIAGDQILPRITSNVSMMASEPEANPLAEWLESIEKFKLRMHDDTLVLPAHGEPFHGVQQRLDYLAKGHYDRLDKLEAALKQRPHRAVDCFGILFDRDIDDSVYGLATGEAMAHLQYLEKSGRIPVKIIDNVQWFGGANNF
ncbi:hypothetical protein LPB140_04705 [Sphingorhabdus lutea]|uniref:Metallo-beta-lactamase domain-containing protein n=2 Tax=Sphingorhabdus lutea TaxID=1913578 RepID=A0A1L3JEN4_9SPHN|nr:hypothetical protein LPB140_04705 [Sphingorhabdus lutea]